MYKTILVALITAAGFTGCRWDKSAEVACSDPDKTGIVHYVPDAGSTLALLSLGTVALVTFRRRLS
jgi:VPDSG-CTERM motif